MESHPNVNRFDRLEIKVLLDARQRRAIESAVRARMMPDPYGDAEGCYPIVSLYLDDAELSAYWDRDRRIASRRKLRVRVYGGASTRAAPACFVEIKHKYGGRTAKRRIALPVAEALAVVAGEAPSTPLTFLDALVVREAQTMVRDDGLTPCCVMRYDRHAYLGDAEAPDLRITFDSAVRTRARDLALAPDDDDFDASLLPDGASTLEIKVDLVVPWWLAKAVGDLGPVGAAVSKYALAAERLLVPPYLASLRPAAKAAPTHNRNGRMVHGHVQPVLRRTPQSGR
ncbi:MAG: polyphosphate polymerase domain-containing protein [Ardenticatenales bacterium]